MRHFFDQPPLSPYPNIVLESEGFLTVLVLINMFLALNASHPFHKMHAKGNISTKVFTKWITCITHQIHERVAQAQNSFHHRCQMI